MAFKKTGNKENKFECKILEDYGTLSSNDKGYELKFTYTSWNGNDPKYDLRSWKDGRGFKGITLTGEEVEELYKILKGIAETD